MTIGGFFTYDNLLNEQNHFLKALCPPEGELVFLMSGRCAIDHALKDLAADTRPKVAYVPIYTCETVLAPFEKEGYRLVFYDVDEKMCPIFDKNVIDHISILLICGYYGFRTYDQKFVQNCSQKGITIMEDTTHSIFSEDGIDPYCDYIVGSLRKWLGVPSGGFAIKTKGAFKTSLLPLNTEHITMRREAMSLKAAALNLNEADQQIPLQKATTLFWDAEMMLRKIFSNFESDPDSIHIINYYDINKLKKQRRENYTYLLHHLKPNPYFTVVFSSLPNETVPSHFTIYCKNREMLQTYLNTHQISSTAYWPQSPLVNLSDTTKATYIYDHVLSIPCDQRYNLENMAYICDILNQLN